jgi:hypothetical protein
MCEAIFRSRFDQFVIEETAKTNPKAAGQTPETLRLTESSILDEIKKSGFVE